LAAVEGTDKVLAALRGRVTRYGKQVNIAAVVGYTQSYAVYVHENLEAYHPVGQAKFLEQPARTLAPELAAIVREGLASDLTMEQSLLRAGLRLQRESQLLCPVDTGALRASAFTTIEEER
jgi:hypothetical protein